MPSSSLVEVVVEVEVGVEVEVVVEVGVGVVVEVVVEVVVDVWVEVGGSELGLAKVRVEVEALEIIFGQVGGGGWEDELKNKTNLSQSWS